MTSHGFRDSRSRTRTLTVLTVVCVACLNPFGLSEARAQLAARYHALDVEGDAAAPRPGPWACDGLRRRERAKARDRLHVSDAIELLNQGPPVLTGFRSRPFPEITS